MQITDKSVYYVGQAVVYVALFALLLGGCWITRHYQVKHSTAEIEAETQFRIEEFRATNKVNQ